MTKIDVDSEVFAFLQAHATPFVDTPNDVLRRLLLDAPAPNEAKDEGTLMLQATATRPDVDAFVNHLLQAEFGGGFRRRPPYRLMFESDDSVVYFQNFNKETDHLWYRVTEQPWRYLTTTRKRAWVCFTNPVERFAYVVPVEDIEKQVQRANWDRPYLEVNIDPASSRWTELDWNLDGYRRQL